MSVSENDTILESTVATDNNTWENASLYFTIPYEDPDIKDCQPAILKTEIAVSF